MDERDSESYDFLLKFTIVGDAEVGKSQILNRFLVQPFSNSHQPTMVANFGTQLIQGEDYSAKVQLWDSPNVRFFDVVGKVLLRGPHAVAVVLDSGESVENQKKSMSYWFQKIKAFEPNAQIYFMMNKTDLRPCLSKHYDTPNEVDAYDDFRGKANCEAAVNEWNGEKRLKDPNHQTIPVMYCSAKNNKGIDEAFTRMAKDCCAKIREEHEKKDKKEASNVSGPSSLSHQNTFGEHLQELISNNPFRSGGSAFFLAALIVLLIIAAFPFGSFLALGPLSAVAVAALIGGGGLLLWNIGCSVVNAIRNFGGPPLPEGDEDHPGSAIVSVSEFTGNAGQNPQSASYKEGRVYQNPSDQTRAVVQPAAQQQDVSKQQKL